MIRSEKRKNGERKDKKKERRPHIYIK